MYAYIVVLLINQLFFRMQKSTTEIAKYDRFLNETLRPDYMKAIEQREKIIEEMRDYEALLVTVNTMQKLKVESSSLKTLVNVGKHFFVNAVGSYNDKIIVKMMEDLFVELPLERAIVFIEGKIKILEGRATVADQLASHIRANIDLVLSSLEDYHKLAEKSMQGKQSTTK